MAQVSAERFGGEAVVDGEARLTFEDVAAQMLRVGRALLASGVEPGDRVALWAPNSASWIPAALGIQATGAWLVPLNTRFRGEEAAFVLRKSGARVLLAVDDFLGTDYPGMVREVAPDLEVLDDVVPLPGPGRTGGAAWEAFLARGDGVPEERIQARIDALGPEDICDVMFTSGTTGTPKGVMLRHGASMRAFSDYSTIGLQLGRGDRHLVPTPFFHCFGYKAGWMISLMFGAVTVPLAVFDAEEAMRLIQDERITHMPGAPTIFLSILDHPRRDDYDLSTLRSTNVSAAAVPVEVVHRLRALGVTGAITGYGLTEHHALVSVSDPHDPPDVVARTVGKVLPDVEVRIVDDDGRDRPPGEPGELLCRGYPMMSGYFDDPEATAAVIVDGWLHTGDVAVLDEAGYLRITDRKKDMFIVGGFNVAPAEVEKALMGFGKVGEVAVVGAPDPRFGEVGVAFVIPKPGVALEPGELLAFASKHLANYKVPRRVEVVDTLPRNATGKVLKNELRALVATGG
jgi:acyl-CoA synthetase (AMP-forming)/AMP-acid ligase II